MQGNLIIENKESTKNYSLNPKIYMKNWKKNRKLRTEGHRVNKKQEGRLESNN